MTTGIEPKQLPFEAQCSNHREFFKSYFNSSLISTNNYYYYYYVVTFQRYISNNISFISQFPLKNTREENRIYCTYVTITEYTITNSKTITHKTSTQCI